MPISNRAVGPPGKEGKGDPVGFDPGGLEQWCICEGHWDRVEGEGVSHPAFATHLFFIKSLQKAHIPPSDINPPRAMHNTATFLQTPNPGKSLSSSLLCLHPSAVAPMGDFA